MMLFLHVLLLAILCVSASAYDFGSYYRPYSAQSPWNCKPKTPVVFANHTIYQVYESSYYPAIQQGTYSTGVFLATASDPPATVYALVGYGGINNVDAIDNITLPHWPADALPATGSDGHCDIYDSTTGILHSFWILRQDNTSTWRCAQYAWGWMDGMGFGDPAHFYLGARAVGVAASGGIIRKHEANDGTNVYPHALAMSLTYNSLQKTYPGYVYPATSADYSYTGNSGMIPEGALMMLPPDYNYSGVASFQLRKVAETLKQYGAYVVDRNTGTPFVIYVENGSNFSLSNCNCSWDNAVAAELQRMRANLMMVNTTLTKFVDGNGNDPVAQTDVNLLSMRGATTWDRNYGTATAHFDTWSQSLIISESNTTSYFRNTNGLGVNRVVWGTLVAGTTYNFSVIASVNVTLGLEVVITNNSRGVTIFNSGNLRNGQVTTFTHPAGGYIFLNVYKLAGPQGSVRGFIYAPAPGTNPPTAHPTMPPIAPTSSTTVGSPDDTNGAVSVGISVSVLVMLFALLA